MPSSVFKVICEANAAGTSVSVSGPDGPGLLACITATLHARGYNILETKGETLSGPLQGVKDTFVIARAGAALGAEEEAELAEKLTAVAENLYLSVSRIESKSNRSLYCVDIAEGEGESAGSSVVTIEGPDADGLLGTITTTLSQSSCTVKSFGGETLSTGEVRDRFVVQVRGKPVIPGAIAPLARRIQEACHKLATKADSRVIEKRFNVTVKRDQAGASTVITVNGPDVPGLLSKLSSALSGDGYEIVAFEAGTALAPSSASSSSKVDDVHDVFRITRDDQPLSAEESDSLQLWITQVCDLAYADATDALNLSKLSAVSSEKPQDEAGSSRPRQGGCWSCFGGKVSKVNADDTRGPRERKRSELSFKVAELTNLERQGLVAALKQRGHMLETAAELLRGSSGGKEATTEEKELLQKILGDQALSDAMKRAQIDPNDLIVAETLGSGAFGEVRAGTLHGTPVAIKTMHRKGISSGGLDLFKAECELGLTLRHPNVVQLLGACWSEQAPTVFLVMERCSSTLTEALGEARTGTGKARFNKLKLRLPVAIGVARAMSYLHSQKPPVLHRDLKPDNVLLTHDLVAKVSDFGSSRDVASLATTQVGTPLFSAPEVLAHEPYDGSADVWSFGCIVSCLYYMSNEPYSGDALQAIGIVKDVVNGKVRPRHPDGSPLGEIGRACNCLRPADRPTFLEVVERLQDEKLTQWVNGDTSAAVMDFGIPC